ncbi:hypothetical protein ACFQ1S_04780 [Kibdelosporangium lantanae]|uniref:Uncharacterized protein n=1 Tax=Kibdelosporangium lantanae TaxID=1497396 RepID=A0ABW3M5T1_9PSEU
MTIERVRVLHGHISMDTAYLVDDYPYGRVLRCKIRYWVETATKGAKKGQQRFVSQTTNPRVAGERWNKPNTDAGYDPLVFMYLNSDEHVKHWGIGAYDLSPVKDARLRLMGIYDQMTAEDRGQYDGLVAVSRRYVEPWDRWTRDIAALARHISETGQEPMLTNGVWQRPDGRSLLSDPEVYFTAARELLD